MLVSGEVQAPSDTTAKQLFGYEQVAKRIANIRLTNGQEEQKKWIQPNGK